MLAGGYAIRAHGLTERPSGDLDLATSASLDLLTIVDRLSDAFKRSGFDVQVIESKPRMARLEVNRGAAVCEVDLLKEAVGPPVLFEFGPVLTLDDAVGLKVRPLADRALHRDFIDVHAAAMRAGYSWPDLERLGARHTPNWSLADLADRLSAIELRDDATFAVYGLTGDQTTELREWALAWADNILARLASDAAALHERAIAPRLGWLPRRIGRLRVTTWSVTPTLAGHGARSVDRGARGCRWAYYPGLGFAYRILRAGRLGLELAEVGFDARGLQDHAPGQRSRDTEPSRGGAVGCGGRIRAAMTRGCD